MPPLAPSIAVKCECSSARLFVSGRLCTHVWVAFSCRFFFLGRSALFFIEPTNYASIERNPNNIYWNFSFFSYTFFFVLLCLIFCRCLPFRMRAFGPNHLADRFPFKFVLHDSYGFGATSKLCRHIYFVVIIIIGSVVWLLSARPHTHESSGADGRDVIHIAYTFIRWCSIGTVVYKL